MPLSPGQPAPDLELPDQNGRPIRLSAIWPQSPLVLFFYPKDDTTGCTKEACAFRDHYAKFTAAGAQVFGISADSADSHQRFIAKYHLPFPLLSDAKGIARKAFGVKKTLGIIPGRVTFVIGRDGIIRHAFDSGSHFEQHVEEALAGLA